MSIEAALRAVVIADAGFAALAGERFFPVGGRQGAGYPYATYQRISTPHVRDISGPSGLDHPRFQIDCWGDSYPSARALGDAIKSLLDGFSGSGAGLEFSASLQDERDLPPDESTRSFRISLDFFLWHERP